MNALPPFSVTDQSLVLAVALMSLRLAGMLVFTPVMQAMSLPASARVVLVLALALALVLGLPSSVGPAMSELLIHPGRMVQAGLMEMALGATLGLGLLAAFAAVSLGASLLDLQLGFGLAQVIDPVTRRQLPMLTTAFNLLAVLMFYLINGHHALMRALAYSLERFPLGQPWSVDVPAAFLAKQLSGLFGLGFALFAPVVFCVLLAELALGVMARNLPQMNMLVIGIPVKIIVGVAAIAIWLRSMGDAMSRIFAFVFQTWSAVFDAAGATGGVR